MARPSRRRLVRLACGAHEVCAFIEPVPFPCCCVPSYVFLIFRFLSVSRSIMPRRHPRGLAVDCQRRQRLRVLAVQCRCRCRDSVRHGISIGLCQMAYYGVQPYRNMGWNPTPPGLRADCSKALPSRLAHAGGISVSRSTACPTAAGARRCCRRPSPRRPSAPATARRARGPWARPWR